jgi:hypothetical protein
VKLPTDTLPAAEAADGNRLLERTLFAAALLGALAALAIGLTRFPIYFFCDEALQANLASQLVQNRFRDFTGTFLPPYFLNDQRWAVSLSVYVHLIPTWLFGKSIFVTRATSVAVAMMGTAGAAIALRVMRVRFWWVAPLVLAAMPMFFLHARTAFEAIMTASFYACFLCAYLLYRYRSPRYLFVALLFGAATFYAYTAGQGVMLVAGVLLLLSDLRYHLHQRWKVLLGATLFALLLALPYVRYRRLHPGVVRSQLEVLNSYWIQPIPLSEKIEIFGRNYLEGFDPRFWFSRKEAKFVRHQMRGMSYIPLAYVPFLVLGAGVCVRNFRRSSAHRAVLFSPLATPFAGAAAEIDPLRVIAMVVPAALLTVIGIDQIHRWIRRLVPYPAAAVACAAAFALGAANLTVKALVAGPTWYTDYGLYGMQYGAREVFSAIREELARSSDFHIRLSPSWANNPSEFVQFFLTGDERNRVTFETVDAYLLRRTPLSEKDLHVMTADEYQRAVGSQKVVVDPPVRTLPYPDGRVGFYFARMRYSENADAILAAEREERRKLEETTATLEGRPVTIRHSRLDMGRIPDVFDGRPETLARGLEANPFVLEMVFPTARTVRKVRLSLGAMDLARVRVRATPEDGSPERSAGAEVRNRPASPRLEFPFPGGAVRTRKLRIEIEDVGAGEISHVHVYELGLD